MKLFREQISVLLGSNEDEGVTKGADDGTVSGVVITDESRVAHERSEEDVWPLPKLTP